MYYHLELKALLPPMCGDGRNRGWEEVVTLPTTVYTSGPRSLCATDNLGGKPGLGTVRLQLENQS